MLAWRELAGDALRRYQHKIVNEVFLRKRLLRGGNLAKRPSRSNKRPDFANFSSADQIRQYRLVSSGGADQQDVL